MPSVQDLADAYHAAVMRKLAVEAFAPRNTALLAAATADEDDAWGKLFAAAKLAHSFNAASTISSSTSRDAIKHYHQLSYVERRRLFDEAIPKAAAKRNPQTAAASRKVGRLVKDPAAKRGLRTASPKRSGSPIDPVDRFLHPQQAQAPKRSDGPTPSGKLADQPVALAAVIIRNARPHPVTWGAGHPPYDRFDYLPSGHRDLPEQAPRAFYDAARGGFTERDHLVGLAQAHESGAAYWSAETKRAFALDPDNIYSISPAANMEKSYRDPAEWLPADPSVHVRYAAEWVLIKTRWSLTYDEAELAALRKILDAGAAG